jgi:hypothetical protein
MNRLPDVLRSSACCFQATFAPHAGLFEQFCCKHGHLADFDPCVTQRFPLGDPEFSTGSRKLFLASSRRQKLSAQQRVAGTKVAHELLSPTANCRRVVKEPSPLRLGGSGPHHRTFGQGNTGSSIYYLYSPSSRQKVFLPDVLDQACCATVRRVCKAGCESRKGRRAPALISDLVGNFTGK